MLMDPVTQQEIKDRIAEVERAIDLAGGRPEQLAPHLGVEARSIRNWQKGGVIRPGNLAKLREFLRKSGGALPIKETVAAYLGKKKESTPEKINSDDEFVDVPLREATGSMGGGSTETGKKIRQHLKFRRDWLRDQGATIGKLTCVKAFGDSMLPTISDDSVVLVDEGRPDFSKRKVYYIRYNGSMYIKRLDGALGDIQIISDNDPEHPIHVEECDDFEIIGRALWMGRRIE